jgi:hypothetical protein
VVVEVNTWLLSARFPDCLRPAIVVIAIVARVQAARANKRNDVRTI